LISTWIYINKTLFLLSIDYAVMEKSKEIYTLPAEFGWSDLGSWGSLRTLLPQDEAGNAKVGKDIRLYERTAGSCSQ
jgi:mannose-1-phosphate guanylyltransferase